MSIRRFPSSLTVLGTLLLLSCSALAMGGTSHIASAQEAVEGPSTVSISTRHEDGRTVTTIADPWPEGVLELVNHPLRTDGWHPWFTEWPNDVDSFDIEIRYPRDVDHLVQKLAAIKAPSVRLELRLTEEKWRGAHAGGRPIGAEFRIGNQALVNHWFRDLRVDEKGVHVFGLHRLSEPWTACPPTLTLYTGHAAVALDTLNVPLNVDVVALVGDAKPGDAGEAAVVRAMEEFAAAYKAKQEAARKSDTAHRASPP
jgi:hypothetical protein